jgi:uncharacterized protein
LDRARGDAWPDSDLDVLIDTVPRGALPAFDLFKVMHLIQDATGLETQISMRCSSRALLNGSPTI